MFKLLRQLKKVFSYFFMSTKSVNLVQNNIPDTSKLMPEAEQVEENWFVRKNDLVNEFVAAPTPVYGSHLDHDKPVGYLDDYGKFYTEKRIEYKDEDEQTNYRIEKTYKELPKEELLEDDIELLKKDKNYVKPTESEDHFVTEEELRNYLMKNEPNHVRSNS